MTKLWYEKKILQKTDKTVQSNLCISMLIIFTWHVQQLFAAELSADMQKCCLQEVRRWCSKKAACLLRGEFEGWCGFLLNKLLAYSTLRYRVLCFVRITAMHRYSTVCVMILLCCLLGITHRIDALGFASSNIFTSHTTAFYYASEELCSSNSGWNYDSCCSHTPLQPHDYV